ncbi:cyclin-J-like [Hyposmocoma kahamanoa]|uniref:cyclin-J-like n=1 Tax=Hyposmocoma kahamanoa TaxID=1477025 RepID=UPI000E6D97CA|nr:cyclin-J-like [Hyposmocoma kahamanoa]
MSDLNLSSDVPSRKVCAVTVPPEKNMFSITDEDYQCEYTDSIFKYLLQKEQEKPPIHLQSPQLAYRGALVQQLRNIVKKLGMSIATLHCAVAHLDLFMDAHRLRSDRMSHVALACLSLAAKSEEKFNEALTLKVLSAASGVQLCGKTFRKLEWMIGQHLRWKLLYSTAVTFASILAKYVVQDSDLTSRNPVFVKRIKRDGAKLLEAYLDLSLSDVRLKAVESVDVGCACVACARADLGLCAWPSWLATISTRKQSIVAPIAKLLQKMMAHLKSKESGSIGTPNVTPYTPPNFQISLPSNSDSTPDVSCNNVPESHSDSVLDLDDSNVPATVNEDYHTLPTTIDVVYSRVDTAADYRFFKANRLLDGNLDVQPSTSVAVKRGCVTESEIEAKKSYLGAQVGQPQDVLNVCV